MKPCLVDVNIWLALVVPRHIHHRVASGWFDRLGTGEAGLCRFVQLGLVRLLGNSAVMGAGAISASDAWAAVGELMEDEGVEFLSEPPGIDGPLAELCPYPTATTKLVSDAYLAAIALAASRRIATMDGGFRQFRGVEVELLR